VARRQHRPAVPPSWRPGPCLEAVTDNRYVRRWKRKDIRMSALTRFLGDSPLRVALKLIVISFLVGLVMSAFGWTPWGILMQLRQLVTDVWNMGFRAVDRIAGYFLLGAAVVIPVFIVLRLLNWRRG
jgi:Family of unknown function (DUF6460)